MPGRSSKKRNEHFEKIKKEMTVKKQKAKKQENAELSAIKTENMESGIPLDIKMEVKKMEMVIFRIGEEEFAFGISQVKEIIRLPSMTRVPNAPFFVTGLCSLRGELLPVIDSRKLFNMADTEYNEGSRIIVTDIEGKKVGLVADRVSEVISVEESMVKDPPGSIRGMDGGVINGILLLNHGKRLIMILDAHKIVHAGNLEAYSKQQAPHKNFQDLIKRPLEEEQIVIFNIGMEEYAFRISCVKEIIRLPEIMKVPNTAGYIEGVLSIRNQLLAVIHLGRLLGMNCEQTEEYSRVVIINSGSLTFGVIVDKVSQVMRVRKDSFKSSSFGERGSGTGYAKGFFSLNSGKRLVMVLEPLNLVSHEDVSSVLSLDSKMDTEGMSPNMGEIENSQEHVVIFKLGKEEFGIRINYVKEVNRISDIVHFPGAPAFIDGMVNLRGEVLPVLNLKILFNENSSAYESSKFLVVEFGSKRIGIRIDSVSEVLKFPKSCLEEASEVLDGNDNIRYIDAIAKLNGGEKIVLILNLPAVLSFM
ncbi:MAG: chemotaxis protein CheW [Clostridiales bacterium]|jgi:purine-binding chemotaxis protein CheW|nr:chemotaxis protein CheW [Eubacteriales bacterium]MDH7565052.1 chemotaxis protein CheW [Clostridiales bacterium]